MTMVQKLRSQATCLARVAGNVMVAVLVWAECAAMLQAQPAPVHFNHAGIMPPGAIGSQQLLRGGPLPGYFQPVEIKGPPGTVISTAEVGHFAPPDRSPLLAGMLIGQVYRLRVTNIPEQPGLEVYPTIEVIDRLFPPMGLEFQFPIPIELTQEELEMALDGKFVTRVIYLEEPDTALPVAERPDEQTYFEAAVGESPLDVADTLGRPMAILRMGGRMPSPEGPDEAFMFGSPALVKWKPKAKAMTMSAPYMTKRTDPIARVRVKQTSAAMPLGQPTKRGAGR